MARALTVHMASTQAEKEEIFRLRYEVYIEEMDGASRHEEANSTSRQFRDEWDDQAHHLYVRQGDAIVGCVRFNFRIDGALECEEGFALEQFAPAFPDHVGIVSRLALHPKVRGSAILMRLMTRLYELAREKAIRFAFLDCHPKLIPLYSRLGFRIYRPGFKHPKYTFVIPMVLVIDDVEFMEKVSSPFLTTARRFPHSTESRDLLLRQFPAVSHTFVSADANQTDFWGLLRSTLVGRGAAVKGCALLADLTDEETKLVLSFGQIVSCQAGDPVVSTGEVGHEVYVILDGSFQVVGESQGNTDMAIINILTQGETFGEVAYLTERTRCSTVVALENSNLLILNGRALDKITAAEPALAARVFRNLTRIIEARVQEVRNPAGTVNGQGIDSAVSKRGRAYAAREK
ncbi:MAG TPA: GNAT family N-acetyltransferase [Nitrospirales bacterium]